MIDSNLVSAVRERRSILFVGAGVSRTLELPSFRELIGSMAHDLGYDTELFEQLAEFPTLAEFYRLEKEGIGELRSSLDAQWHGGHIDIRHSELHRLIVEMNFPLIYTTNWDRWLEKAHDEYDAPYYKIVSVADIRDADHKRPQIVKFHGDFSDDDSLILTEPTYLTRLELNSPLDVKLRADAIGRTVLFIGYALTDMNMRRLLFMLHESWNRTAFPQARPRSFLVMDRPNPVQSRVLKEWGVDYLVAEEGETATERLTSFMRTLHEAARSDVPPV